jgi:hypothetical protein
VALVAIGLSGYVDPGPVRTTVATPDYRLSVMHPRMARSGQPVPLRIEVRRPGGFDDSVTLEISRGLLNHADFQNWYPNPSAETGDQSALRYEFDAPPGDLLAVSLDARMQPNQLASSFDEAVSVLEKDSPMITARFRVNVAP